MWHLWIAKSTTCTAARCSNLDASLLFSRHDSRQLQLQARAYNSSVNSIGCSQHSSSNSSNKDVAGHFVEARQSSNCHTLKNQGMHTIEQLPTFSAAGSGVNGWHSRLQSTAAAAATEAAETVAAHATHQAQPSTPTAAAADGRPLTLKGLLSQRFRKRKQLYGKAHIEAVTARLQSDGIIEPVLQHQQPQEQLYGPHHQQRQQYDPSSSGSSSGPSVLFPADVSTISWPGHGVFFFWQLGVLQGLQQAYGLQFLQHYRFIGSSSGAIASVTAACQLHPDDVITAAVQVCDKAGVYQRRFGFAGIWGQLLHDWLQVLLPEDAANRCNDRVTLLTTAMPWLYHVPISHFNNREDLIQAIMGSAHIPFLMDGTWSAPLQAAALAAANSKQLAVTGSSKSIMGGKAGSSGSAAAAERAANDMLAAAGVPAAATMAAAAAKGVACQSQNTDRSCQQSSSSFDSIQSVQQAAAASNHQEQQHHYHQQQQQELQLGKHQPTGSDSSIDLLERIWQTSRCIDGNFWYTIKGCYRGYAPADGSTALVLEPQQDDQLAARVQGLGELFTGLRLLTVEQAQGLYAAGLSFAERTSTGQVMPLHIRRKQSAIS